MAQQLPVELWTQIHCLACTDDGFAGRALSRVSKDWRSISAPFKFQSIALVGARPILRFVALLDATPEANVESLFVGCARPRPWLTERLILQEERARGLVFSERLFPELGISPETEWVGISMEAIESSVQRILTILAGTLATLHVHVYYPRPSPLFYKLKFPRLRVLVLHGVFGISTNMGSVDSLPALRYLRLSGSPTPGQTIKPSVLLNLIANAAPCLIKVHLTQSALSAELSVVTRDLQRALERTTLRRIEKVIIELEKSRSRSPMPGQQTGRDRGGLIALALEDGRVKVVTERKWWVDVQAALMEWENEME